MGIFVPDLTLDTTGIVVANAYVAVSKNNLYVQPETSDFRVVTSYSIWNSHADRMRNKQPLDRRQVRANVTSLNSTYASTYAAVYDVIKAEFPGYVDDVEPSVEADAATAT